MKHLNHRVSGRMNRHIRWPGRSRTKTLDIRAIWRKTKSDLAQSVCRAKRMSDLAQNVFGRCPGPDVGQRK